MRMLLLLSLALFGTVWTAGDANAWIFRRDRGTYSTNGQSVYSNGQNYSSSSSSSNTYYPNNRGSGYWPGYSNFNLYPGYMSNAGMVNGRPASYSSGNSYGGWQR